MDAPRGLMWLAVALLAWLIGLLVVLALVYAYGEQERSRRDDATPSRRV